MQNEFGRPREIVKNAPYSADGCSRFRNQSRRHGREHRYDANAFLPVVPLADIERAGDTMVVSARVSRTTLAALGVPIDPARVTETVDTELLVRGDGSVLAVRFVF